MPIAADPKFLNDIIGGVALRPMDFGSMSPLVNFVTRLIRRASPKITEGTNIILAKAWHGLHYLLSGMV